MTTWVVIMMGTMMFSMPAPKDFEDPITCNTIVPGVVAKTLKDATTVCVRAEVRPVGTIPMEFLK